jgi:polygalacturonase
MHCCRHIQVTDAPTAHYTYSVKHADFHLGPGPVNLNLAGTDVNLTGTPGQAVPASCADKFVPFPR